MPTAQVDILLRSKADKTGFAAINAEVSRLSRGFLGGFGSAAKFGVGMLGAQQIAGLLKREIDYVIDNIERIPGIPSRTVASIQEAKRNMSEFRKTIDQATAATLAFGADFGTAVGVGAAGLLGFDGDLPGDIPSATDAARQNDPNYDAKVSAARAKLRDEIQKGQMAELSVGQQIEEQRKRGLDIMERSKASCFDELKALEMQTEAQGLLNGAKEKERKLNEESEKAEKELTDLTASRYGAVLSAAESLAGVLQRIATIENDRAYLDSGKAEEKEKIIKLTKEQIELEKQRASLEDKIRQRSSEAAAVLVGGLEEAITSGRDLEDVLRDVAIELVKLWLKRKVLDSIFSGASSGSWGSVLGSIFGGGSSTPGKSAMGTDNWRGGLSWVGEDGPELLNIPRGSQIIPNNVLGRMGGAGGTTVLHQVINVSTGVSATVRAEMLSMLPQIEAAGASGFMKAKKRGIAA